MVYRAIGALLSPPGLSIVFAEFHENAGAWTYELKADKIYPDTKIGNLISQFIEENNLQYKVALITTHSEIGDLMFSGASIAVATELPVITDLTAIDAELGGNGEFYKSCTEKLRINEKKIDDVNKSLCIAFMGILRWREEYNFLSSVTGASRSCIGGAIWLGQEA